MLYRTLSIAITCIMTAAACNVQLEPVQQQSGSGGGGGGVGGGGAGGSVACEPTLQSNATVIACNLPPQITVAAVDATDVYLIAASDGQNGLTAALRVLRVDKATGEVATVYDEATIGFPQHFGRTAQYFNHSLVADDSSWFSGATVNPGADATVGIKAFAKSDASESLLSADSSSGFGMPLYQDATHLYYRGASLNVMQMPVLKLSKTGGMPETLVPNGEVVGVRDGFVYYMDENDDLLRVSSTGGAPQLLVQSIERLADGSWSIAVGDTHVYYAVEGEFTGIAFHEIYQVPLAGGAPTPAVSYTGMQMYRGPQPVDGTQTAYGPHYLAFVEGELTFLASPDRVVRVAPGTLDVDEAVLPDVFNDASGRRVSPARFDGQSAFATYQRGGFEGPLEGILVSAPY